MGIDMINTFKSLGHNQFEFARWAPEQCDRYKIIRVQQVSDKERRFSTIMQNIMTVADSTLLRTAFIYSYKPRQHIFFRNKWWVIVAATDVTQDVAPQALGLIKGGTPQFILEISETNGYDVK